MIKLTQQEFRQLREAVALTHLFMQTISRQEIKRSLRNYHEIAQAMENSRNDMHSAFQLIAKITHRENCGPAAQNQKVARDPQQVNQLAIRNELENVSALKLPDIEYAMVCAMCDLPMFSEIVEKEPLTTHRAATLMAWAWEAGRRFGIGQAIEIWETSKEQVTTYSEIAVDDALNAPLDLTAPLPPIATRTQSPNAGETSESGGTPTTGAAKEIVDMVYFTEEEFAAHPELGTIVGRRRM